MESDAQAVRGVRMVREVVEERLGWIFREQERRDFGIDAHIEVVSEQHATGRLVAAQIKCGPAYLRERVAANRGYVYRGRLKHLVYWLNHSLPVMLIL